MNCRYCDQEIEAGLEVKTYSYWWHMPFVCHAECQKSGELQEAMDCQTIDADCNDCIWLKRSGKEIPRSIPRAFIGTCLKFNKSTVAYPHFWTGRECFEHRRAR